MIADATFARTLLLVLSILSACGPQTPVTGSVSTPAGRAGPGEEGRGSSVILADGSRIEVELAVDDETRARGLMFRESLSHDKGMLFLFPADGRYPFWMKNTLFPLDMIWIDHNGTIVATRENVPPCRRDPCPSYEPGTEARYVLELAGGEAKRHGLSPGASVSFQRIDRFPVR